LTEGRDGGEDEEVLWSYEALSGDLVAFTCTRISKSAGWDDARGRPGPGHRSPGLYQRASAGSDELPDGISVEYCAGSSRGETR